MARNGGVKDNYKTLDPKQSHKLVPTSQVEASKGSTMKKADLKLPPIGAGRRPKLQGKPSNLGENTSSVKQLTRNHSQTPHSFGS